MSTACVALLSAAVLVGGGRTAFIEWGGDPARGVLVNKTPGARPFDPPDPARPTFVFVHGWNPTPRTVHLSMADRFAEAVSRRFGAAFNVLAWDWNAATFVSLRASANEANSIRQGCLLAAALRGAGIDPTRAQLIGHSSGCIVATAAARGLTTACGQPALQLTLLEPASSYHSVVFDRLAAGSAAYRVENYWAPGPSGFGNHVPHQGVRNWQVDGPTPYLGIVSPRHSSHLAVVRWYLATVDDPNCPAGFNHSLLLGGGS